MKNKTLDGNTACAEMAYYLSEVSAIYPITPSSTMAELVEQWSSEGRKNIFNQTLTVSQMQSEAGVSGAIHGSLQTGALATTFTASQGLLLMIPNMYKIAGECLPCVFHISARTVATHALSIFGDHSDVMACRGTGFNMLCSTSVQECYDMALASHLIALKSSLPVLHFFDGFRTSHEIQKISIINDEDIKKIYPYKEAQNFKNRALTPTHPVQRGTSQNPDVFFQNREKSNVLYNQVYDKVVETFNQIKQITNREYKPYEYYGHSQAEKIIVVMGSAVNTIQECVDYLNKNGEKVGVLNVRLYRPFVSSAFCQAIPKTVKKIAVLDRTKECGSCGEPLYQDVCTSLKENNLNIDVIGGRYGLGGKEFNLTHALAVFKNLNGENKNHFTVGIEDDETHTSLPLDNDIINFDDDCYELKFYGLGSDGTVSANKNSIKIIGENTNYFVQAYFEYDSKKSGSLTTSHLRISNKPIKKSYNPQSYNLIAIHNFTFIGKYDLISDLKQNGIVLLNTKVNQDELNNYLPSNFINTLKEKNAKLYIINAQKIANQFGLGGKINVIMQTAFFKLVDILPFNETVEQIKQATIKTYSKKGDDIVNKNLQAINLAVDELKQVDISNFTGVNNQKISNVQNEFFNNIINPIEKMEGSKLPVSKFSVDGTVPTNTAKYLKRGISFNIPKWIKENCIQCGFCTLACPHSAIRSVLIKDEENKNENFETINAIGMKNHQFKIQISPLDCTGCGVCAKTCPALKKALGMTDDKDYFNKEIENYNYSLTLKKEKSIFSKLTTKGLQFYEPYFEFNYACAGCGETPYIKALTQLFGDRMIIANATGCSSIYGGSFPVCPYTTNQKGHGPAWANSLFEDNAEFGYGMALTQIQNQKTATQLIEQIEKNCNTELKILLQKWKENNDISYEEKDKIKELLQKENSEESKILLDNIDILIKKSIWIIGGDGWAYDIGYGGLDHILSSNANVNVLVLDSEVYSNTGGQSSKSTPRSSICKFNANGKRTKKKDLGAICMANNNCYVASISLGADANQALKALKEAEEFNGPSIVICYSPCINHGFNMSDSNHHMKLCVECGYWNLYRYNPNNEKPLILDSDPPTKEYQEFLNSESRYTSLYKKDPKLAQTIYEESKKDAMNRLQHLLNIIKVQNNE